MPADETAPEVVGAEAAAAASEETVEAIDRAAKENDDPVVGEILDEAATRADTAANRVGWLRSLLKRRFGRGS